MIKIYFVRTIFYLLFMSIFSMSAIAHNESLKGKIQFKNGLSVSDVTVAIKSLNKYSLTNQDGEFEFSALPYGKYELEVFSLEIRKSLFEIEHDKKLKTVTLEVEPSLIDLDEVIISANSKKKELETQGFAVNVIEMQRIAVQSVQTNELLDKVAGVKIRQEGGLGSRIDYNIKDYRVMLSESLLMVFQCPIMVHPFLLTVYLQL